MTTSTPRQAITKRLFQALKTKNRAIKNHKGYLEMESAKS